ncbi:single-stranded DNA-binding protein [Staphylococcus epidermidis]|uniref:ERF family protein n=1 Tax=Staphylococcus TaxID=1279 RepID=UPI0008A63E78|nr:MULTISPECIES: ERF family protein [Staphylococcus]MBC2938423.1 ERF family protein [Staphylococcus epidermidis]MBC3042281.1 ERF family protein [Staphylococcus epidermidis]MBC3091205.1 ERF family protein [Staphylococcus epidermidis]MCD8856817.1 ERF family protein [Staphylococcus epidermidis]MCG1109085.1 ERF family protein [Staphylococcus epidermidis]
MTEQLNLYQKIADVKANIEGFTKDTKGYNYSYVSGSQVLHRIRNKMIEHNLLLVPKTSDENYKQIEVTRFNKKASREITTSEFVVEMKLTYLWINADKPEEQLEVSFYSVGQQDDVSKAHGTALTYAERYFLMKFFNIPTDEDDADAKQKQEKYNKASSQTVGVLKQEVLNFIDLMKSLDKEVSQQQVEQKFGIQNYTSMTEQQAVSTISKIQNMANKYKENSND